MAAVTTRGPARAVATPDARPSVLAIVVTHQGRAWLRDCLVALNTQTYPLLDVLVVDDASPDFRRGPHLKRIVKRHLRRRRWGFLRTRRPLGYGGAINWAMSRVRTDADLLLFVHDDAALDVTSVERMVARMAMDEDTAIVGPKIVSWGDAAVLEEVGMAVDRFGYPYKGLERGEIDLGQHDVAAEVFYVTSTCMLVRHEVFRALRGWDARMKAFSEDLDLCWRARLAGHEVVVEPAARARHAIALATGRRRSRFAPSRYFIRRNRLRAVAKNASALRLVALLPQFVLLSFLEMIAFVALRQPGEIFNLVKALAWNLVTSPQTLSERVRVQRSRRVSDAELRRLTVRETTRLRAYVGNQAERLEDAWGRRAELLAQRSTRAREVSQGLAGWPAAAAVIALALLALGFRHFVWAPPAAVGELLPYPERATALWRSFLSPWQPAGLGYPGATSPAMLLLGAVPPLAFGATGAAQKLLIAGLGALAFLGGARLVAEVADRPARLVAGGLYLLGAVGYAGMRSGALAGLAFGAAAPFALRALLSAIGWTRPPGWDAGRGIARIAVTAALCGAFVPGALVLLAGVAVLLAGLRLVVGPRRSALAGVAVCALGLAGAWALLLPWSAGWAAPDGVLAELTGPRWRAHTSAFADHGMLTVLLGRTPEGPALVGAGTAVLGVVALLLASGQRRRLALALTAVVVASGWFVGATASGLVRPIVANPVEAGVLASAALAALGGLAVAAFRLDLPRRRLGWMHALALLALGGAGGCIALGLAPALWRAEWTPGRGLPSAGSTEVAELRSLITAEAEGERDDAFRVLWVGPRYTAATSGPAYAGGSHVVTGPDGRTLGDLFTPTRQGGSADLATSVDSISTGATDVGGHLLGAFNVRLIVLDRSAARGAWLGQRDLAVVRSEPSFVLLRNSAALPRAALFEELPDYVAALAARDPTLAAPPAESPRVSARRLSASRYEARDADGPGVVWLAESAARRWEARIGERPLEPLDGGWGNAFAAPAGAAGELSVTYPRTAGDVLRPAALALAWIVALGAAASRGPVA